VFLASCAAFSSAPQTQRRGGGGQDNDDEPSYFSHKQKVLEKKKMSQNVKLVRRLILSAFCLLVFAAPAFAGANCWCRINLLGTGGPPEWDLGSVASYAGLTAQSKPKNQDDCRTQCAIAVDNWFNAHKDEICKKFGQAGLAGIIGQSQLGTRSPETLDKRFAKCCEKKEIIVCPPPSVHDVGRVPVRCKKELGYCNSISPKPPNGTNIGNDADPWGFWWNGAVIQLLPPTFYRPREIVVCP
jgi:hypothetical protein